MSHFSEGDTGFVLMCSGLVFIMTPGVGFFYGGLARSTHVLSTLISSMLTIAVIAIQWFIWGFSLVYSTSGGPFIGDLSHAVFIGVSGTHAKGYYHPSAPTIPMMAFMRYQLMFAIVTPALAIGGAAERVKLHSLLVFIFVWATVVYDVVARWTWGPHGWLDQLGALDFAGGGPVHIASGWSALAYVLVVGRREGYGREKFHPHNISFVILGTAFLWFGWFGFNAGSAVGANVRALNAAMSTQLSAAVGGLTWAVLDYMFIAKKLTSIGFCSGVLAGLVSITPGSGHVSPQYSIIISFLGSTLCFYASQLKIKWKYDDAFDVFSIHGVGGCIGTFLVGIFAQKKISNLTDIQQSRGGWLDGNFIQIPIQLAEIFSISFYSFFVSYLILVLINKIPFLGLRLSEEHEAVGTDIALMGEQLFIDEAIIEKEPSQQLFEEAAEPERGSSTSASTTFMTQSINVSMTSKIDTDSKSNNNTQSIQLSELPTSASIPYDAGLLRERKSPYYNFPPSNFDSGSVDFIVENLSTDEKDREMFFTTHTPSSSTPNNNTQKITLVHVRPPEALHGT